MRTAFILLTAAVIAITALGLNSCAPGSSLSINPDGSISFSGAYVPKGKVIEVKDEK